MILDAGFLIAIDRGELRALDVVDAFDRRGTRLSTTEPVVAQVWRTGSQARLGTLLKGARIHPLADGRQVGRLLADAGSSDVVDAHLVLVAALLGEPILTGDPDDLTRLATTFGRRAPTIYAWP